MKYIQLFEDFNEDYERGLYESIKKVIVKLYYDTDHKMEVIASLLHKNGISKPISAQLANIMSVNKIKDPTRVDSYIQNIIHMLEFTKDKPIISNMWGMEGT